MKKNIVMIVMLVLVIGLSGFVLYDKIFSKDIVVDNLSKEKIESTELEEIEKFINKQENNAFILMNYYNGKSILTEKNYEILKYSINSSDFSRKATLDEIKSITNSDSAEVEVRVIDTLNMKNYIKEKTNYDINEDDINSALNKYLNKKSNLFYYFISDEIFEKHEVEYGYKMDNKYYIILDDNSEISLIKIDGKYYFNSSNNIELGQNLDK